MRPSQVVDFLNMMSVASIIPIGIILGCLLAKTVSSNYQSQTECANSHTEQSIIYMSNTPLIQEVKVCDKYKAR